MSKVDELKERFLEEWFTTPNAPIALLTGCTNKGKHLYKKWFKERKDKMQTDLQDIIEAVRKEGDEDNKILRELLWIRHGHEGLYGDDGEMQCSVCMGKYGFHDYKRTPAKEMQKRIIAYNIRELQRMKKEQPDGKDDNEKAK